MGNALSFVFFSSQASSVPEVKEKEWTRNPIDNFVLARLVGRAKAFSPADKATLLRRFIST